MFRILVTDGMEKGAVQKLRDLDYEVVEKFYELDELKEKVKRLENNKGFLQRIFKISKWMIRCNILHNADYKFIYIR